jgi:hypothetical protein
MALKLPKIFLSRKSYVCGNYTSDQKSEAEPYRSRENG